MASLPVKAVKNPANTGRVSLVSRRLRASRRRRPAGAGAGGRRARIGRTARREERPESSARSAYRVESWVEEVRIFTFHHAFVTYRGHPMQSAVSTRMHTWARRRAGCCLLTTASYNTAARSWTAPIMALTTQRLSLALGLRPSWRPFACAAAPG